MTSYSLLPSFILLKIPMCSNVPIVVQFSSLDFGQLPKTPPLLNRKFSM